MQKYLRDILFNFSQFIVNVSTQKINNSEIIESFIKGAFFF